MKDLRRRAAERLPGLLNLPEFKLGETLAPIRIVAKALAGTSPLFWAADLFRVRNISIPVSHASDGHIAFQSEGGIMLINLSGVASYAFYVEAVIRTPTAQTLMHWDTAMGGDPVHGTMTSPPWRRPSLFRHAVRGRTGDIGDPGLAAEPRCRARRALDAGRGGAAGLPARLTVCRFSSDPRRTHGGIE